MKSFILEVPLGYSPTYGGRGGKPLPQQLVELFEKLYFLRSCVRLLSPEIYECELEFSFVDNGPVFNTVRVSGQSYQSMRLPNGIYLRIKPNSLNKIELEFRDEPLEQPMGD